MNKFEHVSSGGHRMSLAREVGAGGLPCLMSRVNAGAEVGSHV